MHDSGRHAARWVGRRLVRVEDARLLTGAGRFVGDLALPGCLHVAFVRSAHARAAVESVACAAARALPGVVAVFAAADLAGIGRPAINRLVPGMTAAPFEVLAGAEARAVGQPIAAVVAERPDAALDAAELVEVAYRPLAPTLALDDPDPPVSHAWRCGDVEAAFAAAVAVADVQVAHARVAPMPLEPRACAAQWDAAGLTVWLPTQSPHRARRDLAAVLAVDESRIRVIAPDVGGAFGGKASLHPEDAFVAWAAMRLRRPVAWHGSRGEDLLAGSHGRGGVLRGAMAFARDGTILALRADLVFPLGHWMTYSAAVPARNAARILPGPYRIDALDVRVRALLGNSAAVGIYRGAGRPEAAMLLERLLDDGARRLAIDPLALRRRNLRASHAHPVPMPSGERLDSGDYRAVLDEAAALAGYDDLRTLQRTARDEGRLLGVGTAMYIEPCGQGWESAAAALQADGTVVATTGATAQGQGRETAYAQIVADVLCLPPDAVAVRHGDTGAIATGIGALASRGTAIGGSAMLRAAEMLRAQAVSVAARVLAAPDADLILGPDGFAAAGRLGARLDWRAVAEAAGTGLTAVATYHTDGEAWSAGCVIAVASIDRETGVPRIERLAWVDDAGAVINPLLVEGQLLGGMAQGFGEAMMERIVYDAHGQLLTGSLMDYAMPRAADMPPVTLRSLETASPANPLGAKGVGEAGCIGVPAAIVNAVVDALSPLGVRHLDMPLTAEKIWRALRAATEKGAT